jgi:hypothetical protein
VEDIMMPILAAWGRQFVVSNWSKWTNWLLLVVGVVLLVFARVTGSGVRGLSWHQLELLRVHRRQYCYCHSGHTLGRELF